jgi:chorismate mutase
VPVRAIRGATQLTVDDPAEMAEAVQELIGEMLERNGITADALISIILTATPDLRSTFPATAARGLGLGDVPLLSAMELDIVGALPRVVRAMAHVEIDAPRSSIAHVYTRGAQVLRQDLAQ